MRPIVFGTIAFFGSGVLWFLFSVTAALEHLAGEVGPSTLLMYLFGALFFTSLPMGIIGEIIRWRKRKKDVEKTK